MAVLPSVLELDRVHKVYGEGRARVHALAGVTLAVRAGEVVLLMGPSGSGKTTLLSIMGCLLRPSRGSIRVLGADVTAWDERRLPDLRRACLGFVFQHFNLLAALTARENVEVALALRGVRGGAARAASASLLEKVGLAPRAEFVPADLSGGEKQRVSIARALAGDPPIILADEPTGNLDSENGRRVAELLVGLARQRGKAVVIVTHDERIAHLADRIERIQDGRLVAEPSG